MGFVKSFEEISSAYRERAEFYDAAMLTVMWETKPEIVERLLPPPLKPTERPLVLAFVANYPRTNFGMTYLESGLFLMAKYDGVPGVYCLAMPVTNDMAMAGGREVFGYPKKMANVELKRNGDNIVGWVERHGIRIFEVRAKLSGKLNTDDALEILSESANPGADSTAVSYNFKCFPAPEGGSFDYNPRLVRGEVKISQTSIEMGEAEVIMKPSDYDPWSEVEIVKLLGAIYTVGNNSMLRGQVVAEADPVTYAPYAFLKWDM
jgi:acetoacetate decarboxylase